MADTSFLESGGTAAVVVVLAKVLSAAIQKITGPSADAGAKGPAVNERLAALEARLTAHEAEDRRFFEEIKDWLTRLDQKLDRLFLRHMKED